MEAGIDCEGGEIGRDGRWKGKVPVSLDSYSFLTLDPEFWYWDIRDLCVFVFVAASVAGILVGYFRAAAFLEADVAWETDFALVDETLEVEEPIACGN